MRRLIPVLLVILGLGLGFVLFRGAAGQEDTGLAAAVGSASTYQGRLEIDGAPADGSYDFRFRLYDAATGGNQVGGTVTAGDVAAADGLFSVLLDFGGGASYSVFNTFSLPTTNTVTASASGGIGCNYGVYNTYSPPTIRHSALEGSTTSIHRAGAGTVKAANSPLAGPIVSSLTCFNNYVADLDPVTCAP